MLILSRLYIAAVVLLPISQCRMGSEPAAQCPLEATSKVISFFEHYFEAKSAHNGPEWATFFNVNSTVYCDAILGACYNNYTEWKDTIINLTKTWPPNSPSEYLYVAGDTNSAVIHFVDTAGLFGAELRIMSAIDFSNGTITRQIDYWDGRNNIVASSRLPRSQYPYDLGLSTVGENAAPQMQELATKLQSALSANNASAVGSLFAYNAVFEDFTLRVRQEGHLAIQTYMVHAISHLPYGSGAVLRHVLGTSHSGGYEWAHNDTDVINGIMTLESDPQSGLITLMRSTWDASFVPNGTMEALAVLAIV